MYVQYECHPDWPSVLTKQTACHSVLWMPQARSSGPLDYLAESENPSLNCCRLPFVHCYLDSGPVVQFGAYPYDSAVCHCQYLPLLHYSPGSRADKDLVAYPRRPKTGFSFYGWNGL